MEYRNRLNGRIIDIASELHGGDWEPVENSALPPGKEEQADGKPELKAGAGRVNPMAHARKAEKAVCRPASSGKAVPDEGATADFGDGFVTIKPKTGKRKAAGGNK